MSTIGTPGSVYWLEALTCMLIGSPSCILIGSPSWYWADVEWSTNPKYAFRAPRVHNLPNRAAPMPPTPGNRQDNRELAAWDGRIYTKKLGFFGYRWKNQILKLVLDPGSSLKSFAAPVGFISTLQKWKPSHGDPIQPRNYSKSMSRRWAGPGPGPGLGRPGPFFLEQCWVLFIS